MKISNGSILNKNKFTAKNLHSGKKLPEYLSQISDVNFTCFNFVLGCCWFFRIFVSKTEAMAEVYLEHFFLVVQDASERLFDKGEMNTFRDDIAFAKVISQALQTLARHGSPSPEPQSVPSSSNTPLQHSSNRRDAVGINPSEDFAEDISSIVLDMACRISKITEMDVGCVFVDTPRYCDDVRLLTKVAVTAGGLGDVSSDPRVQAARQKLLSALTNVTGRIPVCGLLLKQLACGS